MRTESFYDTPSIFFSRFIPGRPYTANHFAGVTSHHFSYSDLPADIGRYDSGLNIEKIAIHKIIHHDQIFELNWPICIVIEREQDIVTANNEDLNVYGVGSNKEEALKDFNRSFLHFWKYYREIPNNKIMGHAKRLKSLFSEIVI